MSQFVLQLDLDQVLDAKFQYDYDDLVQYIEERIKGLGFDTVYVQCTCESEAELTKGDERVSDYLLFKPVYEIGAAVLNTSLFFDAVTIIRRTQPDIRILAWAPTLYNKFLLDKGCELVKGIDGNVSWYSRATPFDPKTYDLLALFYRSLAAVSPEIDGIMFQDDLVIFDGEDVSQHGLELINRQYGTELDLGDLVYGYHEESPAYYKLIADKLTNLANHCILNFKGQYQLSWPSQYRDRVNNTRRALTFGRDYYDGAALYGQHGTYAGQSLSEAVIYDDIVMMSYFTMSTGLAPEDYASVGAFYKHLVDKTYQALPVGYYPKVVFKIQTVDWSKKDCHIPADVLKKHVALLKAAGAKRIGFYPALMEESLFNPGQSF